jgi:hypothetical protein
MGLTMSDPEAERATQALTLLLSSVEDPLQDLAFATLAAIAKCAQDAKTDFAESLERDDGKLLLLISFEYMHFFMVVIAWSMDAERSLNQGGKKMQTLEPLLINSMLALFLGALPAERKARMHCDLRHQLRAAYKMYAKARAVASGSGFDMPLLQLTLAGRIGELLGSSPASDLIVSSTMRRSNDAWAAWALGERVARFV